MNKKEIQSRIEYNDGKIALKDFTWDEKTQVLTIKDDANGTGVEFTDKDLYKITKIRIRCYLLITNSIFAYFSVKLYYKEVKNRKGETKMNKQELQKNIKKLKLDIGEYCYERGLKQRFDMKENMHEIEKLVKLHEELKLNEEN